MKLYEALRRAATLYADRLYNLHYEGMCNALDSVWQEKGFAYDFMEDTVKPFIHQYSSEPIQQYLSEPIQPSRIYWWNTAAYKYFNPQIRIDCLNTLASYAEYLDI